MLKLDPHKQQVLKGIIRNTALQGQFTYSPVDMVTMGRMFNTYDVLLDKLSRRQEYWDFCHAILSWLETGKWYTLPYMWGDLCKNIQTPSLTNQRVSLAGHEYLDRRASVLQSLGLSPQPVYDRLVILYAFQQPKGEYYLVQLAKVFMDLHVAVSNGVFGVDDLPSSVLDSFTEPNGQPNTSKTKTSAMRYAQLENWITAMAQLNRNLV